MESALAWIGQIADWIGKFFPRRMIVTPTYAAIKYVKGNKVKVCLPGVHWYWPFSTEWDTYPTARQADRLQTQTFTTTDNKVVIVGGLIIYEVKDIMQLLPRTHSAPTTIKDIALTAVHDVCCNMTWEQLQSEQQRGTLDTKLRKAAQQQLNDYGVNVIKLMLIDLAPTKVLRLSMSSSSEEN